VLRLVGRREPERSEGDRSATSRNTTAHPDPEDVAQAKRRRFTAEYKQSILTAADQAKGPGGSGALLRRVGLCSSLLATWHRERDAGVLQATAPEVRPSALGLSEESVEFAAGGVEGALVLFRAVVNEWATVVGNRVAEKLLSGLLSQRGVVVEVADDLSAQQPKITHVAANRPGRKTR